MWLDSIVYLYASTADAETGANTGGTGFLLSVDLPDDIPGETPHCYVITNAHVIEGGFTVPRVNLESGGFRPIPIGKWIPHPDGDDVAAAAVELPSDARAAHIPIEMAVSPEMFDLEELSPGDEAFFIGRFVYRDGKRENTPTVRFGSIAQVGGDPIYQKERLSGRRYQETILVECHSLSGFSGSPVFAYRGSRFAGVEETDDPNVVTVIPKVGQRVYLVGIDWGSDPWTTDVLAKESDRPVKPGECVRAPSGMGLVVPAWKLKELLEDPVLLTARREREGEVREHLDSGYANSADDASVDPTPRG